jgi:hypothetical protein
VANTGSATGHERNFALHTAHRISLIEVDSRSA